MQGRIEAVEQAATIGSLVPAAIGLGRDLARLVAEDTLSQRAAETRPWGCCPECGKSRQSKVGRPRQLTTSIGVLKWSRAVGRCPAGCRIGQIAPLDDDLGLESGQRSSCELISLGCLLAVNVPFATTGQILERAVGGKLAASTIWSWVRGVGARALQVHAPASAHLRLTPSPRLSRMPDLRPRRLMAPDGFWPHPPPPLPGSLGQRARLRRRQASGVPPPLTCPQTPASHIDRRTSCTSETSSDGTCPTSMLYLMPETPGGGE